MIGDGCSFGQNGFVVNDVLIGSNVKIQNNVSVYDNATLHSLIYREKERALAPQELCSQLNAFKSSIAAPAVERPLEVLGSIPRVVWECCWVITSSVIGFLDDSVQA